jgi:hypothetical protein
MTMSKFEIEVVGRLNLGKWNDNGSLEKLIFP